MGAASYVTGSHSFRLGGTLIAGRLAAARAVERRHAADHLQRRPPGSSDVAPADRSPQRHQGRHRHLPAGPMDDEPRDLESGSALRPVHRRDSGERSLSRAVSTAASSSGSAPDGKNDTRAGCVGTVQNWKDISPRVGVAIDLFGDGRTAIKASVAKYVAGQQIATANAANPVTVLGLTDTRPWTDLDGNGLPLDTNGNIQFNELSAVDADADLRTQRLDDDDRSGRVERLGQARLQHGIHRRRAASDRRIGCRSTAATIGGRSAIRRSPTIFATTRTATTRSASGRRSILICRAAAATRSAACRISSRRCSRWDCPPTI